MAEIKLKISVSGVGDKGEVVTVSDDRASRWLKKGFAEPVSVKASAPSTPEKKKKTKSKRSKKSDE